MPSFRHSNLVEGLFVVEKLGNRQRRIFPKRQIEARDINEALVGATVALLSIYDMCKAVDKEMKIYDVQLIEKTKSTVAVSLCEPHRPHVSASQRRVAHRATATTNDSRIKRKS